MGTDAAGPGKRALEALARWDLDSYGGALSDDAVEGRPQLEERFVGKLNILGMYRSVPGPPPQVEWSDIDEVDGLCVGQGRIRYSAEDVERDHLVAIARTTGDEVSRIDFYFAPPLPPIPYHEPWAER